jgi:hypothetical protein
MNSLAFLPASPETTWSLQALGRALALATSFETDVRMLALGLRLRDPLYETATPDDFARFVRQPTVAMLARNIKIVIDAQGLWRGHETVLSDARDARNFIAHQAAEDLERIIGSKEARDAWRAEVESRVRSLAMGKLVMSLLLPQVIALSTPSREAMQGYADQAVAWVCGYHDA